MKTALDNENELHVFQQLILKNQKKVLKDREATIKKTELGTPTGCQCKIYHFPLSGKAKH